jgi:hypothetical protein
MAGREVLGLFCRGCKLFLFEQEIGVLRVCRSYRVDNRLDRLHVE